MTNCSLRLRQKSAPSWENWLRKKWKASTNWPCPSSSKSPPAPTGATWNNPSLRHSKNLAFIFLILSFCTLEAQNPLNSKLNSLGRPILSGGNYAQDAPHFGCDSPRELRDFI